MYRNPTPQRSAAPRAARTTTTSIHRSARRLYCLGVLLPTLAVGAVAGIATAAESAPVTATQAPAAEICFPAGEWSARAEDRPCDLVSRPQEDGSGDLILGTVGADAADCTIPNPYEERGHFVVHCHRVPNR